MQIENQRMNKTFQQSSLDSEFEAYTSSTQFYFAVHSSKITKNGQKRNKIRM